MTTFERAITTTVVPIAHTNPFHRDQQEAAT